MKTRWREGNGLDKGLKLSDQSRQEGVRPSDKTSMFSLIGVSVGNPFPIACTLALTFFVTTTIYRGECR